MERTPHPAVERIDRDRDGLVDVLADGLGGADLTSLLLEVVRRRAARVTAADVLSQYERDRFTRPGTVDPRALLRLELAALEAAAAFAPVQLSPLAPLGAHAAIAGVAQHRVVTTVRRTEVAADPTNALVLEAAVRRRDLLRADPRSRTPVHLAAVARVTRAQQLAGPRSFAHFSLLGLVSSGRTEGGHRFEEATLRLHVGTLAAVLRAAGAHEVTVRVTDFGGEHGDVVDRLVAAPPAGATAAAWTDRPRGQGYYPSVCFNVLARFGDEQLDVGDGGLVPWGASLLGSAKERTVISGLGLERLAAITAATASPAR